MFAAIRRASSFVNNFAADRRPSSSHNRCRRVCYEENGEGGFTSDLSTSVSSFFAFLITFFASFLTSFFLCFDFFPFPAIAILPCCSASDFTHAGCSSTDHGGGEATRGGHQRGNEGAEAPGGLLNALPGQKPSGIRLNEKAAVSAMPVVMAKARARITAIFMAIIPSSAMFGAFRGWLDLVDQE
jgi:hypothetical protein